MNLAHVVSGLAERDRQLHHLSPQFAIGVFSDLDRLCSADELGSKVSVALFHRTDESSQTGALCPQFRQFVDGVRRARCGPLLLVDHLAKCTDLPSVDPLTPNDHPGCDTPR